MGKKVVMINGSFRKKNTYNLLVQIGQILKNNDIETEILNLFDYEIKDCTGCDDSCIGKGHCNVKDDVPKIMQKILESDGVVFSSPVYRSGVTSKFKAFADRTNAWFHKPETAGKPVLLVTTTAISGTKETIHFLDQLTTGFGVRKGGSISRAISTFGVPVKEKELSKFLSLLQKDKKRYRPSMNEIVIFNVQRALASKSKGDDNRYWKEKDWLNSRYYYGCRMGPAKNIFSAMMFRILSKAIK